MIAYNNNALLKEVVVMRGVLLTTLIIYHSFCIYSGAWNVDFDVPENQLYYWISRICISYLLEGFVFLAGYLFYYKKSNGLLNSFRGLIGKKFKYLLLPCWFFGIIYVILLKPSPITPKLVYLVLSGFDHLWFLPMLFWCYCFAYVILQGKYNMKIVMFALFVFALLPSIPNPFQIGAALHYLSYFFVGMYLGKEKKRHSNIGMFLLSTLTYLISLVVVTQYNFEYIKLNSICSLLGCVSLFIGSCYVAKVCKNCNLLISLSTLSYGIYIIHQFILLYLYVHTDMPEKLGFVLLPWIGFFVSYTGSILIVFVFLNYRNRLFRNKVK